MPLKTKPTTRMERRLLKENESLRKQHVAAAREKNQALTELREGLRRDYERQLQRELDERFVKMNVEIRDAIHEERVRTTVIGALMDAADKKRQLVASLRAEFERLGIPTASVIDIHEATVLRLEELAVSIGNA